jgi:hypothetical protein
MSHHTESDHHEEEDEHVLEGNPEDDMIYLDEEELEAMD